MKFKLNYYLIVGVLVVIMVAIGLIGTLFVRVNSHDQSLVLLIIPKGQTTTAIANRLYQENLIKSPLAFRLFLKISGFENKLQSGTFHLSPSMSLTELALVLSEGTDDIWITIPEGWRREQIANYLKLLELPAFSAEDFLTLSLADEGKLFPDTYLVAKESTAQTIHQLMINTFKQKIEIGLADEIKASSRPFDQGLVMASIIEREAKGNEQLRHVAGILWKRFDMKMALQADATLQYLVGDDTQTNVWWSSPSALSKKIDSRYNTYLYQGLPPQPISNPGINAIKAALDPLVTDDLFYLHDSKGEIHYSQTLDNHNANVQQYLR